MCVCLHFFIRETDDLVLTKALAEIGFSDYATELKSRSFRYLLILLFVFESSLYIYCDYKIAVAFWNCLLLTGNCFRTFSSL